MEDTNTKNDLLPDEEEQLQQKDKYVTFKSGQEFFQKVGLFFISVPNTLIQKPCKGGIRQTKPTPMYNTVRYVCKLPRGHLIEVVENCLLKNITVKSRYSVNRVRAYDR